MLPLQLIRPARLKRPPASAAALCTPPTKGVPDRAPVTVVVIVLVLAAVLLGDGRPVAVILQSLAGAGLIGTELVRRIDSARV